MAHTFIKQKDHNLRTMVGSSIACSTWCLIILTGISNVTSFAPSGGIQRVQSLSSTRILDRRRDDDDGFYYDDEEYDDYDDYEPPRRRRRRPSSSYDDLGGYDSSSRDALDVPSAFGRRGGWRLPESVSKVRVDFKCCQNFSIL